MSPFESRGDFDSTAVSVQLGVVAAEWEILLMEGIDIDVMILANSRAKAPCELRKNRSKQLGYNSKENEHMEKA